MSNKFMIVNCGSSSLRFTVYCVPEQNVLIKGYFEKIGWPDSSYVITVQENKKQMEVAIPNHANAVDLLIEELFRNNIVQSLDEIKGVGHRVVHGGDKYADSVVIDDDVISTIALFSPMASLHNPANLVGIKSMMHAIPDAVHVAVFDTAFHQTMPKEHYMYAVPYEWYSKYGVRKYGFHGTSHKYITEYMKRELGKDDVNLICCHIGNGASLSAVKSGACYNTSMGLTPLDGLIMGTRSGNIDPSIIEYMARMLNSDAAGITDMLNKKSGLLGICGKNDQRDVQELAEAGNENAILAMKMFANSVVDYIAQYYFQLDGKLDAIVFTAGVGENHVSMRAEIVNKLSHCIGVKLDAEKNSKISRFLEIQTGTITTDDSSIPVWVVPTDEEYMILEDTIKFAEMK